MSDAPVYYSVKSGYQDSSASPAFLYSLTYIAASLCRIYTESGYLGSDKNPDNRILWVQDEDPKKYTNVMVWNKKVNTKFQIEVSRM